MESVQRRFGPSPLEVADARHLAYTVASEWGLDPDEIMLVVDELATNAVQHARSEFSVALYRTDEAEVLVEVTDGSPEPPRLVRPTLNNATRGRGTRSGSDRRWLLRGGRASVRRIVG
jgi:anti-sigma regulatory factor (Ser/Thr protein kinase)